MQEKRNYPLRYLGIIAVFCAVCVIYLGRLFYIQIAGRENTYDTGNTTRTVTVQAVRGEIYDRNGIKLVENRYSYDLVLSYGNFSVLTPEQKNRVLLTLSEALTACRAEELHSRPYFPFEGQYPYYIYSEAATDDDTTVSYRLGRVATRLGWTEELPSANDLRDYYVNTYSLLSVDNDGKRRYNDNEIDILIGMYYDMDAKNFRGNGEYLFAAGISYDKQSSVDLMTYIKEKSLPAIRFNGHVARVYLYPGIASHILGSVGPIYAEEWEYYDSQGYQMNDIVGKDGCESAFEAHLHGMDGEMKITEDAAGNILNIETVREPVAGHDIRLTIDIKLQIAAEEGLKENVEYVSGLSEYASAGALCDAGAAVAIDPNTFEVLAIASYPTFNLVTFNEDYATLTADPAEPLRNRALNETYAPGSTLKVGMSVIGLMENAVEANELISCTGKYGGKYGVGCSTFPHPTAGLNVFEALTHSCNSYFCELGNRLGIRTMESYLSRMGLGKPTGLELGGAKGILAGPTYRGEIQSEEAWELGMTWQAAIGQSDHKMSPLQLATYMGTVSNGGTRYAAHLLHSVYAFGAAEPIYASNVEALDSIDIPQDVSDTVRKGMRQMVDETDIVYQNLKASSFPDSIRIGGKTGTAEVPGQAENAFFVCEATNASDKPEIVISVVLEQGAHGYHAARTAGAILHAFYAPQE